MVDLELQGAARRAATLRGMTTGGGATFVGCVVALIGSGLYLALSRPKPRG